MMRKQGQWLLWSLIAMLIGLGWEPASMAQDRVDEPTRSDIENTPQREVPPHEAGASGAAPPKALQLVPPEVGVGNALVVGGGTSYNGAHGLDFGLFPPDANLAVGRPTLTTQGILVEAVNGGLMMTPKHAGRGGATFLPFAAAAPVTSLFERPTGSIIFDPRVMYDTYYNRFVVVALETLDGTQQSFIHIAASLTDDPRQGWKHWQTPAHGWSPGGGKVHVDFISLGGERSALYVAVNALRFPRVSGQAPIGNKYRIFSKAELYYTCPPELTLRDYDEPYSGLTSPWAMRAVSAFETGAYNPVAHFIGSYNGAADRLRVVKIKNPLGAVSPQNKVDFDLRVPAYAPPAVDAPQQCGAPITLDVLSGQLLNAVWRDGFLYTAHTVQATDGSGRNLARWYQIQTSDPPASVTWSQLVQWGEIDAGVERHSFAPAVAVNSEGALMIWFTASSSSEPAGVWATARTPCDPEGTTSSPTLLKSGAACYFAGGIPTRWGDYQGLAVDPEDETTFWGVGEFGALAGGSPIWRTHVEQLTVTSNCPACSCRDIEIQGF